MILPHMYHLEIDADKRIIILSMFFRTIGLMKLLQHESIDSTFFKYLNYLFE